MEQDRIQVLADYFSADDARADKLFAMDINEAVKSINADGHDYTAEEIKGFFEAVDKAAAESEGGADGEISEEALENVSGGIIATSTCIAILYASTVVAVGATHIKRWGKRNGLW